VALGKDGRFTERIEFGVLTADRLARQGNVQPVAMDLSLTAAQVAQVRHTGVRWLTTMDLEPGHYSLRVAGHAVGSKRTGAIFLDIDVPKYEDDDLRASEGRVGVTRYELTKSRRKERAFPSAASVDPAKWGPNRTRAMAAARNARGWRGDFEGQLRRPSDANPSERRAF
jgi:hypothetical protein